MVHCVDFRKERTAVCPQCLANASPQAVPELITGIMSYIHQNYDFSCFHLKLKRHINILSK